MNTTLIIESILRDFAPDADDRLVQHQLEYLNARLRGSGYVLEGDYQASPRLLHCWAGLEHTLLPALQLALDRFYTQQVISLAHRVIQSALFLREINMEPTTLWLDERNNYPVENNFLGIKICWSKNPEEFVANLPHSRVQILPAAKK